MLDTFIRSLGDPLISVSLIANLYILWRIISPLFQKTAVPPIGYPHWMPFGSYYGGLRFFFNSQKMLREGYSKYKSGHFMVPRWRDWVILVTGDKIVEELFKMPQDTLSLMDAAKDELQISHTLGLTSFTDPYHVPLLRTKFLRHQQVLVAEAMDEVTSAFDRVIGQHCKDGSKEFVVVDEAARIVAQTFNRIFVGNPTCSNEDYINIVSQFAVDAMVTATIINIFPRFLHSLIGSILSKLSRTVRRASIHLAPLIEERKKVYEVEGGAFPQQPELLSWLVSSASGEERTTEALVRRMLVVNVASIHTTSIVFTQSLFNLVSRPQYLQPLRKEVEEALHQHGWTRRALDSLPLLDSFVKETMRFNEMGSMSFPRKAMKAFTFSDGTHIPEGAYVSTPFSMHFDEQYYPRPHIFDGFRFVQEDQNGLKFSSPEMTRTSPSFLSFGHGRHACVSFYSSDLWQRLISTLDKAREISCDIHCEVHASACPR
ncbi:hypothetical protein HGRIS_007128 [Hohenbuehelia grisea]|uniref:Cytochrome P450 n=1 Tax=Hohenbuehelia grisea TaxID=104357 RepID=A0ABR3JBV5_9AGAR